MDYEEEQKVTLQQLRPRAKTVLDFMDINPKQEIMVVINKQNAESKHMYCISRLTTTEISRRS